MFCNVACFSLVSMMPIDWHIVGGCPICKLAANLQLGAHSGNIDKAGQSADGSDSQKGWNIHICAVRS